MSISMELRALMAERADSLLRCSGGRFRGWVSGSIFFRREEEEEPGSVACRARERGVRGLDSRGEAATDDGDDSGREDFLVGDLDEDLVGGLSGDLIGEDGCDWKYSESSTSSSAVVCFLVDFLEAKRCFIELVFGKGRRGKKKRHESGLSC